MFFYDLMSFSCFPFGGCHRKQLDRALLFESLRCSHAVNPDEKFFAKITHCHNSFR